MNLRQQISALESRQLTLRVAMAASDDRAAKCVKSGVSFRETYPDDYDRYRAANEEYNCNELALAELREQAARAEYEIMQASETSQLEPFDFQS